MIVTNNTTSEIITLDGPIHHPAITTKVGGITTVPWSNFTCVEHILALFEKN
jgi:hypothetical protein